MTDDRTTPEANQPNAAEIEALSYRLEPFITAMMASVDQQVAAAIAPLDERIANLERRIDELQASSDAPFDPKIGQSPLSGLSNPGGS